MNYADLLRPEVLIWSIPVAAILSGTVVSVLKHRERMAMIEHGIDPDGVKKAKLLACEHEQQAPRLERR